VPIWTDDELIGAAAFLEADSTDRLRGKVLRDYRAFARGLAGLLHQRRLLDRERSLGERIATANRQMQVIQGERLRERLITSVAELASGAGHELNGPLAVISGRTQLMLDKESDLDRRRLLELILNKAHECSDIVTELMDFARPRSPEWQRVNLNQLLSEVRQAAISRWDLNATDLLLADGGADHAAADPTIITDPNHLADVLGELVHNAREATRGNDSPIVLSWRPLTPENHVEILVRDAGHGMTEHVLQKAFDPFYSFRSAGRGRGLGLPRASRLSEVIGGRLQLTSKTNEGTTARLLLPRFPASSADHRS
jgi:signal transduction histidine kinase